MNRKSLTVLLVGSVAVGVGAWRLWGGGPPPQAFTVQTSPSHLSAPERKLCELKVGDTLSYEVSLTTHVRFDVSALMLGETKGVETQNAIQKVASEAKAKMSVKAIASAAHKETILAVRLEDYHATANTQQLPETIIRALERPALARMSSRCELLDIARHKEVSPGALLQVQNILDALNYIVPAKPDEGQRYTAAHQDSIGPFRASYSYEPSPQGHGTLKRKKTLYPKTSGEVTVEYTINRSKMSVKLGQGAWFERLESEDMIVGDVNNHPFSQTIIRAQAELISTRAGAFEQPILIPDYVWGRVDASTITTEQNKVELVGMPLAQGVAQFKKLLSTGALKDWRAARAFLSDYLRANPEQAQQLINMIIEQGAFSEWERAVIMHTLSETGTPQAREALLAAARDPRLDEKTRLQAVAAAGELVNPNVDTVKSLAELGRRSVAGSATEHDLVGNASNHAVGALLRTHEQSLPEVTEAARGYINEMLDHEDPKRLREGLGAVGNSGDEQFVPRIQAQAKSEDATTRRAAMRAFKRMDVEQTEALDRELLLQLYREDDEMVVQDYADARVTQLAEQKDKATVDDSQIISWVAEYQRAEQEKTKLLFIELLGHASSKNSRAASALSSLYWNTMRPNLRQAIGKWLTGDQIAAGRTRLTP